jgi:hypothetical protein
MGAAVEGWSPERIRKLVVQVNGATRQDPYTNSRRTVEETADGLMAAFQSRCQRLDDHLQAMGEPTYQE